MSSLLCGIAPSLPLLILFRVIQGMGGGGLQPMAQAILADTFPPQKRGLAFALYGITAIMAPTIGPTLGGWLTDNYSWRWIFYINLPVGIVTLFLVIRVVEDPPYIARNRSAGVRVDYIGISLLALGVGALQILLDKGQEDDWFGSHFIVALAVICVASLISLVFWELHTKTPVIDMRMYQELQLRGGEPDDVFPGHAVVRRPGHDAAISADADGLHGAIGGIGSFRRQHDHSVRDADRRPAHDENSREIYHGVRLAVSRVMACGIPPGGWIWTISFAAASKLRMVQAFGLGFLFVPINLSAYIGVPAEKGNNVSGLVNFMRNIGSSVGTSMVTTLLARRAQFHQSILASHATKYDPAFRNQLSGLSRQLLHAGATAPDAQVQAYGRLYRSLQVQSQTLAYIDTFMVLAVLAGIMFVLAFIVRKNDPGGGGHVVAE